MNTYTVTGDVSDLGWDPSALADALRSAFEPLGIAVVCEPRQSGGGGPRTGDDALRLRVERLVEFIVVAGPAQAETYAVTREHCTSQRVELDPETVDGELSNELRGDLTGPHAVPHLAELIRTYQDSRTSSYRRDVARRVAWAAYGSILQVCPVFISPCGCTLPCLCAEGKNIPDEP